MNSEDLRDLGCILLGIVTLIIVIINILPTRLKTKDNCILYKGDIYCLENNNNE